MDVEPQTETVEAKGGQTWAMNASQLAGRTVVTADGQTIGTVMELRIDLGSWHVTSLEVRLERPMHRTLGVKRELLHRTTMTIPTELIHSVKDAVILSTSTAELRHRASDALH